MAHIVMEAPQAGKRLSLTEEVFRLGRSRLCPLVLEHPQVSREHARILRRGEAFVIEDLGSRHGTFVNGERIEKTRQLNDGDVVRIVDFRLRFQSEDNEEAERTGAPAVVDVEDDASPSPFILSTLDLTSDSDRRLGSRPEVKLRALLDIGRTVQSHLSLEGLLPEVLDSVFRVFPQAEHGFVLLVDDGGNLVPKASRSRKQGGDSPVRVSRTVVRQALEKKQAVLSRDAFADGALQGSESISGLGMRSILCAPLLGQSEETLGVLQVHSDDPRRSFTQEDLEVLVSVAATTAMAVENARLRQEELANERMRREGELAWDVQRRFLPRFSPRVHGYEFFAHYDAARFVGGDYYGFVELPNRRLAVAVGDVSGKGVPAAMVMARLSSDVRYALLMAQDVAAALQALNLSFAEADIEDKFVSLVLIVLDLEAHTATVANAGHSAPLLRRPDGSLEELGVAQVGLPLNISSDPEYSYATTSVRLDPGALVLVYTDGLTEARNAAREMFDVERVKTQFATGPATAAAAGDHVLKQVAKFVGEAPQHDDITMVCFGRRGESEGEDARGEEKEGVGGGGNPVAEVKTFSVIIPPEPPFLKAIRAFFGAVLADFGEEDVSMLVLALDEACSNLLKHRPMDEPVEVDAEVEPHRVRFRVRNFCCPEDVPQVKPRDLANVRPGGLGTHFIGEIMDKVEFQADPQRPGRMTLVLEKTLAGP